MRTALIEPAFISLRVVNVDTPSRCEVSLIDLSWSSIPAPLSNSNFELALEILAILCSTVNVIYA